MTSKAVATTGLLLCFNLLFFSMVSSTYVPNCPPTVPKIPKIPPKSTPATRPPSGTTQPSCPRDILKLGVCAKVLGGLLNIVVGTPPKTACCPLIQGLADLEAAVCLCTAIKANIMGINLNVPLSLSLLLNYCGKNVPKGFQCA